jgi:hypothetical protein
MIRMNPKSKIPLFMKEDLSSSLFRYKNDPNATPRNMKPLVGKNGNSEPLSELKKPAKNPGSISNQCIE